MLSNGPLSNGSARNGKKASYCVGRTEFILSFYAHGDFRSQTVCRTRIRFEFRFTPTQVVLFPVRDIELPRQEVK